MSRFETIEQEEQRKKRQSIFDVLIEARKKQTDNIGKPDIVTRAQHDAYQQAKPKRQFYYNPDTRVIRPSGVSMREHMRIRREVLQEEGYNVE